MKTNQLNESLLESHVVLLQKALEFYANEENYKNNSVEKDNGHIARHSLELIKNANMQIETTTEAFENEIKKIGTSYFDTLDNADLSQDEIDAIKKLEIITNIIQNEEKS